MTDKTFIVRVKAKDKWNNGFLDADLSWDVPFSEFSKVVGYLAQFEMRPKKEKKPLAP